MPPVRKSIMLAGLLAWLPLCANAESAIQHDVAARLGASMAFAPIDSPQTGTQSFSMHGDMVNSGSATPVGDSASTIFQDWGAPPPPVVQSTPIIVPDDPSLKPQSPAASALSPATQSASPGPAQAALGGRSPELPQPSMNDVRQELWREWAEKFQLLQDENTALTEKLRAVQGDGLQDIRVDSVAEIERQALKSRIADLEKEVEQLRSKKTAAPTGAAGTPGMPGALNGAPSPLARTHAD